jgi:hypothetical protein
MKRSYLGVFVLALALFGSLTLPLVSEESAAEKKALNEARTAYQQAVADHGEDSAEAEAARAKLREVRRRHHQSLREREPEKPSEEAPSSDAKPTR